MNSCAMVRVRLTSACVVVIHARRRFPMSGVGHDRDVNVETTILPEPVAAALETWIDCHERHAPGLIEGLYVVGSVALDDWGPGSDVDIVATTADPATDSEVDALRSAFDDVDALLEGLTIDGPILAWSDLAQPPLAALRPWTLDGEFRFDGECSEINPVTWFTLAHHGVPVIGGPVDRLGVVVDEVERRSWVVENVDTSWRSVRDGLAREVGQRSDQVSFDADVVEWCALGAARMLVTALTGAVVSKSEAGEWASAELPDHAAVFADAVAIRARRDPSETVDRSTIDATVNAMTAVIDRITGPRTP